MKNETLIRMGDGERVSLSAAEIKDDILAGTQRLREEIDGGEDLGRMEEWWRKECAGFNTRARKCFLRYD